MVLGATVGLRASTARAQSSSCVDCHYANPDAPCHLSEWKRSAHGRHDVGCEKCHGGDPTVYDAFRAHLGSLGSRNPSSPVNRVNLPRTCGQCHPGPFVEFRKSHHYDALRECDREVVDEQDRPRGWPAPRLDGSVGR